MDLYIPANAKIQSEIFPGFGKKELVKSLFGITFGIIIAMILHLITKEISVTIISIVATAFISVMMCTKIENIRQSVVDLVIDHIRFSNSQKIYPYRYLNEWEDYLC